MKGHAMTMQSVITYRDPGELRGEFRAEHPDCAAVEIWRSIDGQSRFISIECGSPTHHSSERHFHADRIPH